MTSSSPIDAPVSLICEQRRRKLPVAAPVANNSSSNNNNSTPSSSSKSETPSPSESPKPGTIGSGLPPPVPLSTSTPHSKPCCQSAANAGQPFCPTCYVTAILASYKQPGNQLNNNNQNQKKKEQANSSNSDNGGSSPVTPERRPSPPGHQQVPGPALGPVEMLSFLQQAALKQRLAGVEPGGAGFLPQGAPDRPQQSSPSSIGQATPTPQELFFQSLLAGRLPPGACQPPGFCDNLPPQFARSIGSGPPQLPGQPGPPGQHQLVAPPFFMNPGEPGAPLMNPYGPYGAAFDLNGMRRKNATRETTAVLKQWLAGHRKNPYPTKGEKIMLAIISKMTLTQVSTWFANARRRLKKENKGNSTWNSGGAGSGDDQNEGAGSNDDGDTVMDGDDVELQVDEDSDEDVALPNGLDDEPDPDEKDADEPPQRRQKLDQNIVNNNRHEPITPSSPQPGQQNQPQNLTILPPQVPQQPNPVLAASIAALLEQQQNQQPQQPATGINPFANLLQQIYGDRLTAILQLQQQLVAVAANNNNNGNNLNRPNNLPAPTLPVIPPPAQFLLGQLQQQQLQNNGEKNKTNNNKSTIWSIAAEIQSPPNISQN